jgi:uncharacterized metal-binding protein YceD (DUF177 family)
VPTVSLRLSALSSITVDLHVPALPVVPLCVADCCASCLQIKKLPGATKEAVLKDIDACYEDRPWLAMVDSGKGELLVLE